MNLLKEEKITNWRIFRLLWRARVQHIAVATNDIIGTITEMRKEGWFLSTPLMNTKQCLFVWRTPWTVKISKYLKVWIMIDADEEGYLLQIFTKPVEDRPTLFFEIIQRMGGFGLEILKHFWNLLERTTKREHIIEINRTKLQVLVIQFCPLFCSITGNNSSSISTFFEV